MLGMINPKLRTLKLPSEILHKKNSEITVRIGEIISIKEQNTITKSFSTFQYGKYLRTRVYTLQHEFLKDQNLYSITKQKKQEIIKPIHFVKLKSEIESIRKSSKLFQVNNIEAFISSFEDIPHIIKEIGRLREETYRNVGEGSNKSIDLDQYDIYYKHIFLWDNKAMKIIGSYRIGLGKDILNQLGKKGFYLNSLFKIKKSFTPILTESIELGRSFIRKEYQKQPLPLFLLWKAVIHFVVKNNDYRYLIGPVSVSNQYSELSKQLIMEYLSLNHGDRKLAKKIRPKESYKVNLSDIDIHTIINLSRTSIDLFDQFIKNINQNKIGIPVLLKKYLKQNAKVLSFNVDHQFNNCIDGFMLLDLCEFPIEIIDKYCEDIINKSDLDSFKNKRIVNSVF